MALPVVSTGAIPPLLGKYLSQPKVLYVGDSVAHVANLRSIEEILKWRICSAKAYSSYHDENSRWPENNYADVVKAKLSNPGLEDYKALVMASPTVDITNLKSSNMNQEECEQEVINSSKNMFNTATEALSTHKNLAKVVIMDHPPRFDVKEKGKLALFANATLLKLWSDSPTSVKEKIVIGLHSSQS